jgi:spore germination protein GerM
VSKKNLIWISVAVGVLVAAVVWSTFWLLRQSLPGSDEVEQESSWLARGSQPAKTESGEAPTAEQRINVTLYMLSASGEKLVPEEREIPFESSLQKQAKRVVRELLSGSRRGLGSPMPSGVELLDLFVTPQGLAVVNLSKELISNHPGGSSFEELTVYSLANTLIANFPAIKEVQIIVEGREVKTLAGHLDLSIPYGRGPRSLEQEPSGSNSGP